MIKLCFACPLLLSDQFLGGFKGVIYVMSRDFRTPMTLICRWFYLSDIELRLNRYLGHMQIITQTQRLKKEAKKILSRRNQFLIADHEKYRGRGKKKSSLQAVKYNRYKRDNSHIVLCLKSDLTVLDTSLSILLPKKKKRERNSTHSTPQQLGKLIRALIFFVVPLFLFFIVQDRPCKPHRKFCTRK